ACGELLRLIREQEARTPRSRLSSAESTPGVAASRQIEPAKLGRFVKGELDWIVMKALAKERDRRYETANGFAKDIERFLNREPVLAGPPSATYKLKKFVQRNKPQVIAAVAVLLTLIAGITGPTIGLIRAEKQRAEAETARENESQQLRIAEQEKQRAIQFRNKALDALRATSRKDVAMLLGKKTTLGPNERAYLKAILERWQGFAD